MLDQMKKDAVAHFRVTDADGPRDTYCAESLGALRVALQMAVVEHGEARAQALVQDEMARMRVAMAAPRRQPADEVLLDSNAGFGGSPGRWKIAGDESWGCPLCGNPACREWPTLQRLDDAGALVEEFAYHVSECQMR